MSNWKNLVPGIVLLAVVTAGCIGGNPTTAQVSEESDTNEENPEWIWATSTIAFYGVDAAGTNASVAYIHGEGAEDWYDGNNTNNSVLYWWNVTIHSYGGEVIGRFYPPGCEPTFDDPELPDPLWMPGISGVSVHGRECTKILETENGYGTKSFEYPLNATDKGKWHTWYETKGPGPGEVTFDEVNSFTRKLWAPNGSADS